jgi:hypothetical protein
MFFPPLRALKDLKVSNMVLDLWTSFARDGYAKYNSKEETHELFVLMAEYREVTSYLVSGSPLRKARRDISG